MEGLIQLSAGPVAPSSVTPAQWGKDDEDQELGGADRHEDDPPRIYQITDAAGNTLSLVLKVHKTRHQIPASVVSTQYNGAAPLLAGRNAERFQWELEDEHTGGILTHLDQQVRLGSGKQRQSAQAEFNARENVTRIDVDIVGKPDACGYGSKVVGQTRSPPVRSVAEGR